jgi:hypothetical protein
LNKKNKIFFWGGGQKMFLGFAVDRRSGNRSHICAKSRPNGAQENQKIIVSKNMLYY